MTPAQLEAMRGLHADEPSRETVESMRAAVLATMPVPVKRSPWPVRLAVGAAALSAAATLAWVLWPRGPVRHGTVVAEGMAEYSLGTLPDEVVRLHAGTIHVEVDPLAEGERFRVVTGDGVVEVKGTGFDAVAADDRLTSVHVTHGIVEVSAEGRLVTLHGGEAWARTETVAIVEPVRAVAPSPNRTPTLAPTRTPTPTPNRTPSLDRTPTPKRTPELERTTGSGSGLPRTSAETEFRAGWDAYRHDRFAEAAEAFGRSLALDAKSGVAEDAMFWRATALSRAGETAAAREAFHAYLDAYPNGSRADECTRALGE